MTHILRDPLMVTTGVSCSKIAASGLFKNELTGIEGDKYQT
jgi:hypothetical protein